MDILKKIYKYFRSSFYRILYSIESLFYKINLPDNPALSIKYADITEKKLFKYKILNHKLLSYYGIGPVGPNKLWEYPWILYNTGFSREMKVLDAGCGTSPVQYFLAEYGCRIYGIDANMNTEWHGIDKSIANKLGLDINYSLASIDRIPFKDNSFDIVLCLSVIEHIRKDTDGFDPLSMNDKILQKKLTDELCRVLKTGGILCLTVDFVFPGKNIPLESNIDINFLLKDTRLLINNYNSENFYFSEKFNIEKLLNNLNIDRVNYGGVLQTSIGIIARKKVII